MKLEQGLQHATQNDAAVCDNDMRKIDLRRDANLEDRDTLWSKSIEGQPGAVRILSEAHFPELPNYYRGKVRENYDLPDGRRIIISTDRLSAFDRILTCIPYKGQVLTQTARYWFEATKDICPNHVLDYPDPNSSSASASIFFRSRSSCR